MLLFSSHFARFYLSVDDKSECNQNQPDGSCRISFDLRSFWYLFVYRVFRHWSRQNMAKLVVEGVTRALCFMANDSAQIYVSSFNQIVFQSGKLTITEWHFTSMTDLCEYLSQGLLTDFTTILLGWRGIKWWRGRRTTKSSSAGKAGSCQGSWICRQCWECCISACCIWYSSAFLTMLENLQDATLWLLVICCCLKHTYFST